MINDTSQWLIHPILCQDLNVLSIFIAGASSNRADPSPLEPSLQPWTLRSALSHHHSPHNLRHQGGLMSWKAMKYTWQQLKINTKTNIKTSVLYALIIKTQDVSSLFRSWWISWWIQLWFNIEQSKFLFVRVSLLAPALYNMIISQNDSHCPLPWHLSLPKPLERDLASPFALLPNAWMTHCCSCSGGKNKTSTKRHRNRAELI